MIRVADTRAAFERCAEIAAALDPDNPVSVAQLEGADGGLLLHDGGGYAYVSRSSVPAATYAMVRVEPASRGRGVGSALLKAARARTRELGCESLWGRVFDEPSLSFLGKRGFREVARDVVVQREVEPAP